MNNLNCCYLVQNPYSKPRQRSDRTSISVSVYGGRSKSKGHSVGSSVSEVPGEQVKNHVFKACSILT